MMSGLGRHNQRPGPPATRPPENLIDAPPESSAMAENRAGPSDPAVNMLAMLNGMLQSQQKQQQQLAALIRQLLPAPAAGPRPTGPPGPACPGLTATESESATDPTLGCAAAPAPASPGRCQPLPAAQLPPPPHRGQPLPATLLAAPAALETFKVAMIPAPKTTLAREHTRSFLPTTEPIVLLSEAGDNEETLSVASSNTAGSWSNNASIYDEATTQKSSLDCIVECGADIECMYQCIAEVLVPSETDSGTTSLPDILKMVPDIIDGVINTLFDGATTETALEKDKDGVTTDSTVITNEENNETTTVAGNVEFSTLNEIRPLEDPTIAEEETIDADEVAMATVKGITITEEENVEADESTTVSLEEDLVVDVEVTTVTIRDQTSGDEGVEGTTNTNKDSAITENKSFEDAETTTVILKDNTITAEENIDDVEATTVTVDEYTAKIPEGPGILDQATEVNTEEVVTTLSQTDNSREVEKLPQPTNQALKVTPLPTRPR